MGRLAPWYTGISRRAIRMAAGALFLCAAPASAGEAVSVEGAGWLRGGGIREVLAADPGSGVLVFSPDDQLRFFASDNALTGKVHLTQVVPLTGGITREHFDAWLRILPSSVVEKGGFRLDNGAIQGERAYANFRVTTVDGIGLWPRDPSLLFDADFFLQLYQDEVRTPMVPLVMKMYATLQKKGIRPRSVRIVSRNREMAFPLEFGFIPELIRELFGNPEAFREELPGKWKRLEAAQFSAFFGQTEDALDSLGPLLGPGRSPYANYQAAILRFREGQVEEGLRGLGYAADADRDYGRGYMVQAGAFWQKGELRVAERILREGFSRFPSETGLSVGLARVLFEQAVTGKEEDPGRASKLLEEALSLPIPNTVREEIRSAWSIAEGKHPP